MKRVIVACEFSGIVRDSFISLGYDAVSCDLLPTEREGPHIQDDIKNVDLSQYGMMVCHPPCTNLAVSGSRWFKEKKEEQERDLQFVQWLLTRDIPLIALENPVSIISTKIRKPDQYIQPYYFGHPETKKTGLWLKNLPPLMYTNIIFGKLEHRVHNMPPSAGRWKERSRTYTGIAKAMASQWGPFLT